MSQLAELIRNSGAVLLDFDGPVCSVFAGYSAETVATQLREFLNGHGVELPVEFADNRDPLKVLAWVGSAHPDLTKAVEDQLIAAETLAADSAAPTLHADDVMAAAVSSGRPVAIASNNSPPPRHSPISRIAPPRWSSRCRSGPPIWTPAADEATP